MGLLSHFRGVRFYKGGVHFGQTGVDIAFDKAFFAGAFSIAKINTAITFARLKNTLTGRRNGTIAFYPDMPGPWYNARFAAHLAGLKITRDINTADRVFVFDDKTHSNAGRDFIGKAAINAHIGDISKTHVGEVFDLVFGYPIAVDPLSYEGRAVQKSDLNATHDGKIVSCPIKPSGIVEGCAYQKLIESSPEGQLAEEMRVAYVGGDIPAVFYKYKNLENRFGAAYTRVDLKEAQEVLSEDEINELNVFCAEIGLDFGALDVLRDKDDGRIYVVDVNKTCMPVLCLRIGVQMKALRRISDSLLRLF